MPFRRRFAARRIQHAYRKYRTRNPSYKGIKRIVRSQIYRNEEHKKFVHDLTATFNSVGNAFVIDSLLDQIAAGDDVTNRDGRIIDVHYLNFDAWLYPGDSWNIFRLMIIKGRSDLVSADWAAYTLQSTISKGYSGTKLVRKLKDFTTSVHFTWDGTNAVSLPKHIKFFMKFKKPLRFYYTSSAAAAPTGQDLFLCCLSDSAAISHPGFSLGTLTVGFTG